MDKPVGRVTASLSEPDAGVSALRRPPMHMVGHRHLLEDYVGFDVEVHYNNNAGSTDRGVLRRQADGWIELTRNPGKPKQDSLLIPVEAIRMIRPIGPPPTPESMLLRPAIPDEAADEP